MPFDRSRLHRSELAVPGSDPRMLEKAPALGADGIPVMLVRDGGAVHALSDRCAHRGGPLHEGEIEDGCVRCPLHGSMFRLRDGSVIQGPSPYPQPVWETRLREGRIEVRPAL